MACTSSEGALKKEAISLGQVKWAEMLKKEADDALAHDPRLHQEYRQFIEKRSEVEVEKVQYQGESSATVVVVVNTFPLSLRRTLLGVAGKVDPSKSRRFSFGEALALVKKQIGIVAESEKQPLVVLNFTKAGNVWTVQSPPAEK